MYKIYGITQGQRDVDYGEILPCVVKNGTMGLINFYCWCIKREDTALLVDTGMTDEEAKKRANAGYPGGEKYVEQKLKELNVDPLSIKIVLVTHLHGDHFSAHHLYPNATFYIQRRDIEFFTGPGAKFPQVHRFAADIPEVVRLAYAGRIRYIDGDEQIAPGIRVILIGGHTPGSQVVVVTTVKGEAVICGDAMNLYRTMDEQVNGMAVDLLQALLGLDKIKVLASSPEMIIPGHDPLIMQRFPSPIEGVVEIV